MRTVSQQHETAAAAGARGAAAEHVRGGGLVALPTDTVYGLGCRAADTQAVGRLLAAKGRDRRKPPPVLVADAAELDSLVSSLPPLARALTQAFWPGGLTLVLDARPGLGWRLGQRSATIAVRMPDHPVALALLRDVGPMAVTSANRSGQAPATDADGVRAAFPDRVVLPGGDARGRDSHDRDVLHDILLIDSGPTPGPTPSTIVDLSGPRGCADQPCVIRPGILDPQRLAEVVAAFRESVGTPGAFARDLAVDAASASAGQVSGRAGE
ncbi:threonylcarbamoyl-AMP synthase [Actinomyces sp. 2119]|uniref:L-threonylcarbamoyladenylate synthase n=1 Tax=Actinomyces sp. 2119 TaxID=2321393 RepID=UPI000E6BF723|nr:L-threonylcarbamoyladenylate synthase [Actinomyces sp. 2119]RJF41442.1 threonylcarbamoyl-AMP synthase [Actinomyces sp. 2119]